MGQVSRTLGKSGEYLALYDMTSQGYDCFIVNENLCFDIGLTDNSGNLYRVQVKTTNKKKNEYSYQLRICRGVRRSIGNKKVSYSEERYNPTDFEILALVIIPLKKVIYVPFCCMMDSKYINLTGEEVFSLEDCLKIVKESKE